MSKEPNEKWKKIENLLLEARAIFQEVDTGESGFNQAAFDDYVSLNELKLALNELENIPLFNETPKEFWQILLRAANRMQLKPRINEYPKLLRCYG